MKKIIYVMLSFGVFLCAILGLGLWFLYKNASNRIQEDLNFIAREMSARDSKITNSSKGEFVCSGLREITCKIPIFQSKYVRLKNLELILKTQDEDMEIILSADSYLAHLESSNMESGGEKSSLLCTLNATLLESTLANHITCELKNTAYSASLDGQINLSNEDFFNKNNKELIAYLRGLKNNMALLGKFSARLENLDVFLYGIDAKVFLNIFGIDSMKVVQNEQNSHLHIENVKIY